jgi:hypothetical protein
MKIRVLLELENKPFFDEKQFEYAIEEGLIRYLDGGEILQMERVRKSKMNEEKNEKGNN